MDIRGIWKVKEVRVPTPDGTKVFTPDNPPEEMREEAAKHGAVVREDGYAAVESTVWKEENGKIYYDTKIEGEVLGEKVDSFAEIPVTEDGCLLYSYGMILLERV